MKQMDILQKVHSCIQDYAEEYLIYSTIKRYINCVIEKETEEFLSTVSDALLQMCAINWCKMFGSKNNNEIHWSNYIEPRVFYTYISAHFGMQEKQFEGYVKEMKAFRNKYVAHNDAYTDVVPRFDVANEMVKALDNLLSSINEEIPFGTIGDYLDVSQDKYYEIISRIIDIRKE